MHNHYHVVLFIDKDCAEHWSEQAEQAKQPNNKNQLASGLLPFVGNPRAHMPNGLPII
jgi:hypothetical protein